MLFTIRFVSLVLASGLTFWATELVPQETGTILTICLLMTGMKVIGYIESNLLDVAKGSK